MGEREMYGAKCHRCAHLTGPTHEVEPIGWVSAVCKSCSFCQDHALSMLIRHQGMDIFDPEVGEAVRAFRRGEDHPVIDQLRAECQEIDTLLRLRKAGEG